jgi:hypothetical protein
MGQINRAIAREGDDRQQQDRLLSLLDAAELPIKERN